MNDELDEYGKKRMWPNVPPSNCLQGLRKTAKTVSKDNRFPSLDSNTGTPEYEAGIPTTRLRLQNPYMHTQTYL